MGFFSSFLNGASTAVTNQALKTMQAYRKGRGDSTQLLSALKILASAGKLFRKIDANYELRLRDYYWINNDHLENTDYDYVEIKQIDNAGLISSNGVTYVKVRASECNSVNF